MILSMSGITKDNPFFDTGLTVNVIAHMDGAGTFYVITVGGKRIAKFFDHNAAYGYFLSITQN